MRYAAPLILFPVVVAAVEEVEGDKCACHWCRGATTRQLVKGMEGAEHVCCSLYYLIREDKPLLNVSINLCLVTLVSSVEVNVLYILFHYTIW